MVRSTIHRFGKTAKVVQFGAFDDFDDPAAGLAAASGQRVGP